MEETFRGYRTTTTRLRDWNYASVGWYFVTFCTKDRFCCLGDVETARWDVSRVGRIVNEEIVKTQFIRPYIGIDSWIVMPNHVHMIIEIHAEGIGVAEPAGQKKTIPGSLGQIINQIKGAAAKRIRAFDSSFAWQPRYYERIIREEEGLNHLRAYIEDNPKRWVEDGVDEEGVLM